MCGAEWLRCNSHHGVQRQRSPLALGFAGYWGDCCYGILEMNESDILLCALLPFESFRFAFIWTETGDAFDTDGCRWRCARTCACVRACSKRHTDMRPQQKHAFPRTLRKTPECLHLNVESGIKTWCFPLLCWHQILISANFGPVLPSLFFFTLQQHTQVRKEWYHCEKIKA